MRPPVDDEAVADELPPVRRGCEHAIGVGVAVRTCGAGKSGG
jgi:hypothetical protein